MLIHNYLEYWAGRTPDAPCLEFAGDAWSYAELDSRANQVAHALTRLGVRAGDRVAVVAENLPEWGELYFAAFKLGAVLVPLNYRLNPREWAHLVEDAGATALVAQREYVRRAETEDHHTVRIRLTLGDTAEAGWPALGMVAKDCSPDPLDRSADEFDALYQMYTSGTTGTPKGAVLSHRAVDANIRQMDLALGLREGDRALVVMPLFHAGAAVTTFSIIASGGCVLLHTACDAAECVRVLDERDITTATFVPSMIVSMLDDVTDVRARRYERLARIAYGAAPIGQATLRRAMEVFGCGFVQAYGMTECSSMVTFLDATDHRSALRGRPEILRSCGRPVAGTRIRIVTTAGTICRPGVRGRSSSPGRSS